MTTADRKQELRLPARVALAALSVACLGLLLWGAWNESRYVELPEDVPWEQVSWPRTVAGVEAASPEHARALARRLGEGESVSLGPEAGERATRREADDFTIWLTLVTALAFWAVAAFTLAPRAHRPGIAALYGAMLCSALAIVISGPSSPRTEPETLLQVTYIVCLCFVPAFMFRFGTSFPQPMPAFRRAPWLAPLLVLVAASIAAWRAAAWTAWAAQPSQARFEATELPEALTYAFLAAVMLAGLVLLGLNARGAELERERRQAKWVLWGIAIGATPFVFLRGIPRLFNTPDVPLSDAVESLGELMVPAAITVAVVRDRFLDIDVIIRRSLIYTVLALGAVAIAALVILFAGAGLGWPEAVVAVLAGALPALLFFPARQLVSRWVDRTFFRIRHGHERSLARFESTLLPMGRRESVAEGTCAFLEAALRPKALCVLVREDEDWISCGSLDAGLAAQAPEALARAVPAPGVIAAAPGATGVPEVETATFPEALIRAGVRVAQPVARSGALQALILLGEKSDERRYVEEDLKLLSASALRASQALERVTLIQRATEEAVARRNIAALVREKADFFARVAHDLRTPLTAIRWSVRNLSEELAGPLNERQAEYLDSVGAAAGQLGRLVDNLVDLSRLDLGAVKMQPEPVDLHAVALEATSALRPIADERKARIALHAAADLPPIRGRTEAAFQILINLLDNALKYAPEETTVDVDVAHPEGDGVTLSVRDRGPGLPAEGREALFQLFEKGPESPHVNTKGFGIGLHIVKAWTDALGGTVVADNHPEGGARFVVRLPVWKQEDPEA